MSGTVRYGILGASRIARNKHIPAAAGAANAFIDAIASRDDATARAWAEEFSFDRSYGSYQALLDDDAIDAVIITLPNSLHAEWAIKAAQAGKHVLCEKPLAASPDDVEAMFDAADKAGVLLMEGFWTRFHPQLPLIRQTLDSGVIGEIRIVRAELTYPISDWETDSRTRADLDGGALLDAGCYCVQLLRWVMGGEPVRFQANRRMHPACGVDSTFTGLMEFPGGRMGYLATSMEAPFRVCCEIIGSTGRIHTDSLFADANVRIFITGEGERTETVPAANAFGKQLEHFSQCILDGTQPAVTRADSLGNAVALAALKEAACQM